MSKNFKTRNNSKYIFKRKKLTENWDTHIKINEEYLHIQQKASEACYNDNKTRVKTFYIPVRFGNRGKLAKSYPATYQDDTRFTTSNEMQIFDERIHSDGSTNTPIITLKNSLHSCLMQNNKPTEHTTEDYVSPYGQTVAVYTVQKTRTNRKKESIYCGANNAFKLQFYKNIGDTRCISKGGSIKLGDGGPRPGFRGGDGRAVSPGYRGGRPRTIDGPAYISSDRPAICKNGMILIPKGYSVTRLRRDEDGCICTDIPEADYGCRNGNTRNGSFLKKYFQVLMKENTRCICGKRNPRHVCPYPTCKRNVNNVGCQCKSNNAERTGFGNNDRACQCKYKEKRGPHPDRESFFTERALTCCVPVIPSECSKCSFEHKFNPNSKQEECARRTVNIGSNFSFKLGFYKGANYKPVCPEPCNPCCPSIPVCCQTNADNSCFVPIPACGDTNSDSSCLCSNTSAGKSRFYKQFCSSPRLTCKSNSTQSKASLDNSCRCSSKPSNQTVCCCPPPPPKRCYSPCVSPSYELCPTKAKSTSKDVGCCCCVKPTIVCPNKKTSLGNCCNPCAQPVCTDSKHSKKGKTKDASCRCCCDKPLLVECTNSIVKNEKCGPCCSEDGKRKRKSKFSRIKNRACHCDIKPIIFKCTNKEKGFELCCKKCKRPKKAIENDGYCCCDENKQKENKPSKSNVGIFSSFRNKKKKNESKDPVSTKDAKCSCTYVNKIEGEFDYTSVLKKMAMTNRAHKRQCACKSDIDYKKKFGRLLLYNIQDQACCTSETCGIEDNNNTPLYKNIGIGDVDLRKPPCMRKACPNKKGQTTLKLKKVFCSLIKNPTCTIKQKRLFDPLNQTEAAVQHIGSNGENVRLGREVVYRDQGSYAPLSIPTVKEYETNPAYAPPEPVDPNQKQYRLGSSCSFCIELYRGPPPSKTAGAASAGPSRSNAPCGDCPPCVPCPDSDDTPCEECSNTNEALLMAQKAFTNLILRKKKHVAKKATAACQRCNKCVEVPLIKKGFAHMLLTDANQRKATRTCQQTNTASPVRRIVKRRPGDSARAGNGKPNCDPYVCLKRINQDKCCNKR